MDNLYQEEIHLLTNIKEKAEKFNDLDGVKIDLSHLIWYCKETIQEIKNEQKGEL
jgi:hypothetical protein